MNLDFYPVPIPPPVQTSPGNYYFGERKTSIPPNWKPGPLRSPCVPLASDTPGSHYSPRRPFPANVRQSSTETRFSFHLFRRLVPPFCPIPARIHMKNLPDNEERRFLLLAVGSAERNQPRLHSASP